MCLVRANQKNWVAKIVSSIEERLHATSIEVEKETGPGPSDATEDKRKEAEAKQKKQRQALLRILKTGRILNNEDMAIMNEISLEVRFPGYGATW